MFDNVGGKIKGLAVITCFLGIAVSVITGIRLISQSAPNLGTIILVAGSLVSWIGCFTLYGFGELIEKTCENNKVLLWMKAEMRKGKEATSAEKTEGSSGKKTSTLSGITCPSCGCVQPSFRTECWTCGASLRN